LLIDLPGGLGQVLSRLVEFWVVTKCPKRSIGSLQIFSNVITDKTKFQRFLGSLNYISPFIKDLSKDTAILYDRLKKNLKVWTKDHTQSVKNIKAKFYNLPCLTLANTNWIKIVGTDASHIGYGEIIR